LKTGDKIMKEFIKNAIKTVFDSVFPYHGQPVLTGYVQVTKISHHSSCEEGPMCSQRPCSYSLVHLVAPDGYIGEMFYSEESEVTPGESCEAKYSVSKNKECKNIRIYSLNLTKVKGDVS